MFSFAIFIILFFDNAKWEVLGDHPLNEDSEHHDCASNGGKNDDAHQIVTEDTCVVTGQIGHKNSSHLCFLIKIKMQVD